MAPLSQSANSLLPSDGDHSICSFFSRLRDPRRSRRRLHHLQDIIVIALCAVIAGAQDWQQIALFGRKRIDWLRGFLQLPNGAPSHDTFERVFSRLQPAAFQSCFRQWVKAIRVGLQLRHVAIDGKTLRGSGTAELGPLHLVSAWATEQRLSLGQVAVDSKSNEITAIPELLKLLEFKGAIVTIDAMGCQKAIAEQIVAKEADYVLAVKDNQPTLHEDVHQVFIDGLENDFAGMEHRQHQTSEKGHGRTETRHYHLVKVPQELAIKHAEFTGMKTIGMVFSERQVGDGPTTAETRYYISSMDVEVKTFARAVRGHWGIENSLHWQLDMTFGEDGNRVSNRRGAENLALLRKLTLVLLQAHPSKESMACKRLSAALDPEFLEEILQADGILNKV
jgi:predicted transposase YbfD/YdcC